LRDGDSFGWKVSGSSRDGDSIGWKFPGFGLPKHMMGERIKFTKLP